MHTLIQDLRFGARMLMKQPGFTLIVVITLGLGIGATSAIFSFVNGILLRPLPYQDAARLVMVDETSPRFGGSFNVSFPNFLDWREQNRSFTGVAVYDDGSYTLTGGGEPERLSGGEISYDMFEVLGVAPLLGRSFRAEEDRQGTDAVVILSHGLWMRRFAAQSDIIGRTINLDNRARMVIGVMPPEFKFPENADLWVPLAGQGQGWTRNDHGLGAVARLKPGVTLALAQADMNVVARRIEEQNPVTNEGLGVKPNELRAGLTGDYRTSLPLLLGVVGEVKQERLDWSRRRSVYLPHGELALEFGGLTLAVRATTRPENLTAALRRELKALDPDLPLTQALTMDEIVGRSLWQPRLFAILFGVFAAVALLLAAVGIYGVISYDVTQRTHEIGVRRALGAQHRDVMLLVLDRGMRLVVLGLAFGLATAFGLTRLMQTLLFEVKATDPLTYGLIALLLTAAALLACWIPARRATEVDLMIALKLPIPS